MEASDGKEEAEEEEEASEEVGVTLSSGDALAWGSEETTKA